MRMMISLLLLLGSFQAQAQILVVSDIDDTLKISRVLDTVETISNAPKTGNHFLGSAEALRTFVQNSTDAVTIAYVSNAPSWLMQGFHETFLERNRFPQGVAYLQGTEPKETHKLATIRRLIQQTSPRVVILIGDNGERDNQIYLAIANENRQRTVHTWIHQVYSADALEEQGAPLLRDQRGYVTSVDLIEDWERLGFVTKNSAHAFYQAVIPQILMERDNLSEGTVAFPKWINCIDNLFTNPPPSAPASDLHRRYLLKKFNRCS